MKAFDKLDFTLGKFACLLDALSNRGYAFQTFENFLFQPSAKTVILRHDVDRSPGNSLKTSILENARGIRGSYYFRLAGNSFDAAIIKEIAALGHEVGYHYEDVSRCSGEKFWSAFFKRSRPHSREKEKLIVDSAIKSFSKNLDSLRKIVPVISICMHGSPLSKWDSRLLWKYYDYHDYGIIGEPYFDLDFSNILYITDTGRKWNGEKSSVRDKVFQEKYQPLKRMLKSTDNIISAIHSNELPMQMMITVHPQRWSDNFFDWTSDYITQTLKNCIKHIILVK